MARTDDKRAASMFFVRDEIGPVAELTPAELNALLSPREAVRRGDDRGQPTTGAVGQAPDDELGYLREGRGRLNQQEQHERTRREQERYIELTRGSYPQIDDEADRSRRR